MIDGVRALVEAEKALRESEPRPTAELAGNDDTMPEIGLSSTDVNVAIPAITPKA